MEYRITFTVGQGKDRDGRNIKFIKSKLREVLSLISSEFGGYTLYHTNGGWTDENGKLIEEPSVVIVAFTSNLAPAKRTAAFMRDTFNQFCVVVTKESLDVEFI